MKFRICIVAILGFVLPNASAQQVGISISAGVRKTFKINSKNTIDLRQAFQINPEIKKNDKYGDLFEENGFWPISNREEEPDDDDDDDDDATPINTGELNDDPYKIKFERRSTTSAQYSFLFTPWLRSNTIYSLLYTGEEWRHTFSTELDYRPLKHSKKKRNLDMAARALYQRLAVPDDGKYEWRTAVVPRVDVNLTIKKTYILQTSNALNGVWEKGEFGFDRWRANVRLVYIYNKKNRFTFGYQFQRRLDKPRSSHGCSFGYEIRL